MASSTNNTGLIESFSKLNIHSPPRPAGVSQASRGAPAVNWRTTLIQPPPLPPLLRSKAAERAEASRLAQIPQAREIEQMSIAAAVAQRRRNIANQRRLNTLKGPEQSKLFFNLGNNAARRREAIRTAAAPAVALALLAADTDASAASSARAPAPPPGPLRLPAPPTGPTALPPKPERAALIGSDSVRMPSE